MFVIRDRQPDFSEIVGHVVKSVIAVAVGTDSHDRPNIVGTGFASEFSEMFITCWHVAVVQDQISHLDEAGLKAMRLKDARLRLGIRLPSGEYTWREPKPYTWMRFGSPETDVCVFRTVGVAIPPLFMRKDDIVQFGESVGIAGFPMGSLLQGSATRPFANSTIVAGVYDGDDGSGITGMKIAIATSVAGGYSGGPIFSARDGAVVGMVSSKIMENGQWPAGVSLGISAPTIWQLILQAGQQSSAIIEEALTSHLGKAAQRTSS